MEERININNCLEVSLRALYKIIVQRRQQLYLCGRLTAEDAPFCACRSNRKHFEVWFAYLYGGIYCVQLSTTETAAVSVLPVSGHTYVVADDRFPFGAYMLRYLVRYTHHLFNF